MRPVEGMEHVFLRIESDSYPMDGAAILILDPSTCSSEFGFDAVRTAFARGLAKAPVLTRKLVESPTPMAGTGTSYWVTDPDIDVDDHVDLATVRAPGDRTALAELCVELSRDPLPRDRPLWHAWYVDGVADGEAAVIVRFHHAAVDGIAAVEMFGALLDTEPSPDTRAAAEGDARQTTEAPSGGDLLLRAALDATLLPVTATKHVASLAAGLVAGRIAGSSGRRGRVLEARSTLFNRAPEESAKTLALLELPLADAKKVKNTLGVSLGDVVLAMVTSAVRDYLLEHDEAVDRPLSALCPIDARGGGEQSGYGNHWAMIFNTLPAHIEDPIERLALINEGASANKRIALTRARFVNPADAIADLVPPVLWSAIGTVLGSPSLNAFVPPIANLTVSSIPGAPVPLYMSGARVVHLHNRAFTQPGAGLFVAYVGYGGSLDIGITATRELIPDPERLTDGMREHLSFLATLSPDVLAQK